MENGPSGASDGRYVYCVVDGSYSRTLKRPGVAGRPVYGVPCGMLSAIVHRCSLAPHRSDDPEKIKSWIVAHHEVVETCTRSFETVVPLKFNSIIRGDDLQVKKWLREESERLREMLGRVRDRVEYGIQIFWNPKVLAESLRSEDMKLRDLRLRGRTSGGGMKYIMEKMIEQNLATQVHRKAERLSRKFCSKIAEVVESIHVNPAGRSSDNRVLTSLSVLVKKGGEEVLGRTLAEINEMDGFRVRATGPWSPYSFVSAWPQQGRP